MIRKLKDFLGLCNHQWKTIEVCNNIDTQMSRKYNRKVIVGQIYFQECQRCAKIRKIAP